MQEELLWAPEKIKTPEKKEAGKNILQEIKNLKTEVQKSNSLTGFIETFEKSPLFEKISLDKWSFLFKEWDVDQNLYIIKKGILSVEKFTTSEKIDTKQLATLKSWDFLGEASLAKNITPKEASIKVLENSEILKIDAKNELKRFIEENPTIGFELMRHIIVEGNKRLLEANKLIATNHEIEKSINNIKVIDLKAIFQLIDTIKNVVGVDYILYLEKHPVLENFFILKYDSRFPGKMQDMVFEKSGVFLDLEALYTECNIPKNDYVIVNKISIWNEIYGYLIIGRENKWFDGSDKKIFSWASNSFAGIIKKFLSDKEDKNRLYVSEMKKH